MGIAMVDVNVGKRGARFKVIVLRRLDGHVLLEWETAKLPRVDEFFRQALEDRRPTTTAVLVTRIHYGR